MPRFEGLRRLAIQTIFHSRWLWRYSASHRASAGHLSMNARGQTLQDRESSGSLGRRPSEHLISAEPQLAVAGFETSSTDDGRTR